MKKVLIINTVGLMYDGITSVILSYLQAMNLEGLEIYIAGTITVKENIRKQLEDIGCNVVDFPDRKAETLLYFISIIKFIRKNNIDIIHAHGNSGTLAIEMVAGWFGGCKKRIAHSHNTKCNHFREDQILRPVLYTFCNERLACGEEAGRWLFKNKSFFILKNGRDINKFLFDNSMRLDIRKKMHLENKLCIGHVGGFVEQKNHKYVLKIFSEIKKNSPNVKFFLIGEGTLKREILEISQNLDLDICFCGNIDNVNMYLHAMDGMVLPSLFEGLPLVLIEWQLNGLPCVVSDTVTDECKFLNSTKYLSLKESPKKWAQELLLTVNNISREKNSELGVKVISDAGFDILDLSLIHI